MQFEHKYFEDEVRDGFYVDSMMKKAWASQLQVLEEIDEVCEKNHIEYFAEWGTLLGAIRHNGFIPWDDDFDIGMTRENYEKFREIGPKELPESYHFLGYEDDIYDMILRVLNDEKVRLDREFIDHYHGFPYVSGLDIFILDYLPRNPEKREKHINLLNTIWSLATVIEDMNEDELQDALNIIETTCDTKFDDGIPIARQLFILADRICASVKPEDADEITQMYTYVCSNGIAFPKSYYEKTISVPFEHTSIRVPVSYDSILRAKYGDYMRLVRARGGHDYPFYQKQIDAIYEKTGNKPKAYEYKKALSEDNGKCNAVGNIKDQAEQFLTLLMWANGEIRNALKDNQIAVAVDLLEQSQEAAIQLGTLLEDSQGEGFVTVGYLENYCELIYQIHENLLAGTIFRADAVYNEIEKDLMKIKKSIQDDIIIHKSVVFLPYKAAAWDSFDTVWKAANEDEMCDVYVVPIPYYEKEHDESLGVMHYEGDQYPDYVPITDYQTFDFGKISPDVIFIHNPYDEYNLAETVPPFFYSTKLKRYTKKLVYIPWFMIDDFPASDERGKESMKHFCTMPGIVNADDVFVQSEEMRQRYIEVLTQWAGEDTRQIWEQKIHGIGAPQMEFVAKNDAKMGIAFSDGWEKILINSDGSMKKILLYNTTLGAMLEYKELMLNKIENTLSYFETVTEGVVLWWRIQPGMEDSLDAIYPELGERFRSIVKEYCGKENGIFDNTMDVKQVAKLCDAYYGDSSSVVQLFRNIHKPIMIQNVAVDYTK